MGYEYGDTIIETEDGWVVDCGSDIQIVFVDTTANTLEIGKDKLPTLIEMLQIAEDRLALAELAAS
jgi:hypothetical protein